MKVAEVVDVMKGGTIEGIIATGEETMKVEVEESAVSEATEKVDVIGNVIVTGGNLNGSEVDVTMIDDELSDPTKLNLLNVGLKIY